MRSLLCAFLILSASSVKAQSFLPGLAQETVGNTWQALADCGLEVVDAYTPGLPRPLIPADLAILGGDSRVLAYYLERYGFGVSYEWKNPNGGNVHSISASRYDLDYVTPYLGTVAHANRFETVGGPGYNMYCRSYPTTGVDRFRACTERYFTDVVASQLCRFGNSPE